MFDRPIVGHQGPIVMLLVLMKIHTEKITAYKGNSTYYMLCSCTEGLLPGEVRVHVGITVCEKSPALAALAIAANKREELAGLCHVV
jgi:hypothetical protein